MRILLAKDVEEGLNNLQKYFKIPSSSFRANISLSWKFGKIK